MASLVPQMVKNLPAVWETWVQDLASIPGLGRSLTGYSPCSGKESDTTEQIILHWKSNSFLKIYFIEVELIYSFVLVSAIRQSDSVIHIPFHYGLSQAIESSSLCYTVGPCLKNEKCYSLSHVWLFATPWTVARQTHLSMEFSRPEY